MHQSGWMYLIVLGFVFLVALAGWALGKIFPSKAQSSMGNALMQVETLFTPSREHSIEAKEYEQKQDEERGDPPEPGM